MSNGSPFVRIPHDGRVYQEHEVRGTVQAPLSPSSYQHSRNFANQAVSGGHSQTPISQPHSAPLYYETKGSGSLDLPRQGVSLIDGPDDRPLVLSSGQFIGSNSSSRPSSTGSVGSYTRDFSQVANASSLTGERSYDSVISHGSYHSGILSQPNSSESSSRTGYRAPVVSAQVSQNMSWRTSPPNDDGQAQRWVPSLHP